MPLPSDVQRMPLTLVEELNDIAVDMYQLRTDLGMTAWRVFIRIYSWDGGDRYNGDVRLTEERELVPPPSIDNATERAGGLRVESTSGGTHAHGVIRLSEISPRYTEKDLDIAHAGLADNEEAYFEIEYDGRAGAQSEIKSYRPASRPQLSPDSFQWTIDLEYVPGIKRYAEVGR